MRWSPRSASTRPASISPWSMITSRKTKRLEKASLEGRRKGPGEVVTPGVGLVSPKPVRRKDGRLRLSDSTTNRLCPKRPSIANRPERSASSKSTAGHPDWGGVVTRTPASLSSKGSVSRLYVFDGHFPVSHEGQGLFKDPPDGLRMFHHIARADNECGDRHDEDGKDGNDRDEEDSLCPGVHVPSLPLS